MGKMKEVFMEMQEAYGEDLERMPLDMTIEQFVEERDADIDYTGWVDDTDTILNE